MVNELVVVGDGEEALNYFFCEGVFADWDIKDQPAVILLDLKLPKIDGTDVLRIVKSDQRSKLFPVIILTSYPQLKDISQCYELGANSSLNRSILRTSSR